jgi:hypothetical protein
MRKQRLQLEFADEVKKRTIMAFFSDDELMERLVLKGGNLLDLVYKVSARASVDVDFSVEGELGDIEALSLRIEKTLRTTFREIQYDVFDVEVVKVPPQCSADMISFWGGYQVTFKIIEQSLSVQLGGDREKLRRNAASVGARGSTKFKIDISSHEYCGAKEAFELDHLTVYGYTPLMYVCEKLRAICQQMPDYCFMVKRHASARARDFVDIFNVTEEYKLDLCGADMLDLLPRVFDAKRVPLELLRRIAEFRDYHFRDFEAVRASVRADYELRDFDFYFDFVVDAVAKLEILWNI